MKIQYASDLHLEFGENSKYLKENPLIVSGDILVLAGDIGYLGDDNYSKHPFWDWASKNYSHVYVVPGNHELYKFFDINRLEDGRLLNIRDNISCHYNDVVHLDDDTDLILTTLWAHIKLEDAYAVEHGVSDFRRILNGDETLDWVRFNAEYEKCVGFIRNSVARSRGEKIIVATHHVPSFELMSPEFAGSRINGAFTSELKEFITGSKINYWIYGHSHRNIDKVIGKTHCVSNQLGYVFADEHRSFNRSKIIELQ